MNALCGDMITAYMTLPDTEELGTNHLETKLEHSDLNSYSLTSIAEQD